MATTGDFIAARNDNDLMQRLIATAEMAGIPNAVSWVQGNLGVLLRQEVNAEHQTVADVYAYSALIRREAEEALPPLPGLNPAGVTDAYLATAVDNVLTEQTAPPVP